MNKFDDLKACLDSLKHEFLVTGLSETWLNCDDVHNFLLANYP